MVAQPKCSSLASGSSGAVGCEPAKIAATGEFHLCGPLTKGSYHNHYAVIQLYGYIVYRYNVSYIQYGPGAFVRGSYHLKLGPFSSDAVTSGIAEAGGFGTRDWTSQQKLEVESREHQ